MHDRELDDALETAADRAREAEDAFARKPLVSPELVEDAETVEHRAEDLHELARDAATEAAAD